MEGDVPEETVTLRSDLGAVLGALPLFQGLESETLQAIAQEVEWLSVPGGTALFSVGEASDALYVVLSGCLGVFEAFGDHAEGKRLDAGHGFVPGVAVRLNARQR